MMMQLRPDELVIFVLRILGILRRLGQESDDEQRGLLALTIGKLTFQQFRSSVDPARWALWLEITYAALTQSLLEIDRRRFQWAEAQFLLGQTCAEIARWTGDLRTAHRASTLVTAAGDHLAVRDAVGLGLFDWQPMSREIEILRRQLEDGRRTVDYALVQQLTRPALHVEEDLRRIAEAYGIDDRDPEASPEPAGAPGWLRGLLLAFGGDAGPMGVGAAPVRSARRSIDADDATAETLDVPAALFRIAQPTISDPLATAADTSIMLEAWPRGALTDLLLYDEGVPAGDARSKSGLAGWQIGVVPIDGSDPVFADDLTSQSGETTLNLRTDQLYESALLLRPATGQDSGT